MDEPVPSINASKIWSASPPKFTPDSDLHTVSVEVLNIVGGTSVEISKGVDNVYVFYDMEVLAIVHRAKSRSSGLVATKVMAWKGRKGSIGEKEEKKLGELAKTKGEHLRVSAVHRFMDA